MSNAEVSRSTDGGARPAADASGLEVTVGFDASTLARARRNLNDIATVASPDMRRRLLIAAADRSGASELRAAADALSRTGEQIDEIGELRDAIGPRRFVSVVDGLSAVDRETATVDVIVGEATRRLDPGAVSDPRASVLVRAILNGTVGSILDPDTPGLDDVRRIVLDPERIDAPDFDPRRFGATLGRLATYATPAFGKLLADGPFVFGGDPVDGDDPDPPGTGSSTTDDDEIFGTPPLTPWDEGYLAGQSELVPPPDCPMVSIDLPTYRRPSVVLGTIVGAERIPAAIEQLRMAAIGLYLEIEAAVADALVPDSVLGVPTPMKGSLDTLVQVFVVGAVRVTVPFELPAFDPTKVSSAASIQAGIDLFRLALGNLAGVFIAPEEPTVTPGSLSRASIEIAGDPDTIVVADVSSRMLSTYTFGVGKGTYTTAGGSDRPWFARCRKPLYQDTFTDEPAATLLFGEQGGQTDKEVFPLRIPASGTLELPLGVNGNYGQIRLVVGASDTDRCPLVVAPLLTVLGPFEDEVALRARTIHTAFGAQIDEFEDQLTSIPPLLDLIQSYVSILPLAGAAAGAAIDTLEKLAANRIASVVTALRELNDEQRRVNLEAAEMLPESTPVGGNESVVPIGR